MNKGQSNKNQWCFQHSNSSQLIIKRMISKCDTSSNYGILINRKQGKLLAYLLTQWLSLWRIVCKINRWCHLEVNSTCWSPVVLLSTMNIAVVLRKYKHKDYSQSLEATHLCFIFRLNASVIPKMSWDHLYSHGLTLIPAWISNYMPSKMWDEITYPFPNFNGATVEVWERKSNLIPHYIIEAITYLCWD